MEILEFITRNEPIAGLSISDGGFRFVQLKKVRAEQKKAGAKADEKKSFAHKNTEYKTVVVAEGEEALEEGVFSGGEVLDQAKFTAALQRLAKKLKKASKYVIVSLPADKIYSRYFSFPQTLSPEKVKDTMKLTMEFQLPFPSGSHFTDWQTVENENSAFLSSGNKETIAKINAALLKAGFNVVAIEHAPLSISRLINAASSTLPVASLLSGKDGFTVFVSENHVPKFMRTVPVKTAEASEEFRKAVDFFESEYKKPVNVFCQIGDQVKVKKTDLLSGAKPINEVFDNYGELLEKDNGQWLAAIGAASRGALKRSEDKLSSLMAIGAEEAYETKKALAFTGFISSLVISISVFMVAIYAGIWLMTITLQKSVNNQIKALSSIPVPVGGSGLEAEAVALNNAMSRDAAIIRTIPKWSTVVVSLRNSIPTGITLQNVSMPKIDGVYSISGVATDRTQMKSFKKALEESILFTDVQMPISNISEKQNIPFSITLRLKDPGMVYFK